MQEFQLLYILINPWSFLCFLTLANISRWSVLLFSFSFKILLWVLFALNMALRNFNMHTGHTDISFSNIHLNLLLKKWSCILLTYRISWYVLDINHLPCIWFVNILSKSVVCLFYFFIFQCAEDFNSSFSSFMISNFIVIKKYMPTPGDLSVSL